jgi:hypothetical protein
MTMATAPQDLPERNEKDDAEARAWAEEMKRRAEQGDLADDTPYLRQKLQELARKLNSKRR